MSSEAEKWSIAEIDSKLSSMAGHDEKKEAEKYSDQFDDDDIIEDIPDQVVSDNSM